jgi:hypothetical protein
MANRAFDKKDGKSTKRGRPKKAGKETAKAGESGQEPTAEEKPKRTKKSAAKRTAEKEQEGNQATKGARKALRKAVKKAVKEECDRIAKALVEQTKKGNTRSTEMMISLIEKKKDDEGSKRHGGLTAADLLGSEEEWESESAEAMEGQASGDEGAKGLRDQGSEEKVHSS